MESNDRQPQSRDRRRMVTSPDLDQYCVGSIQTSAR
jgi:hypothetical protein